MLTLLASARPLLAQSYDTSAGLRFGTEWGLTVQQRVAEKVTIEGILQSNNKKGITAISVLGEKHWPVISKRFNIYAGAGPHFGFATKESGYKNPLGVSLVGGGEFTIARINLSYDIKPAINLVGGDKNVSFQTGISVRYVINKKEWNLFKKKDDKKKKSSKKNSKDEKSQWWKFWEKD
jgi:hypothetical protein